jgi:hypothetical protein
MASSPEIKSNPGRAAAACSHSLPWTSNPLFTITNHHKTAPLLFTITNMNPQFYLHHSISITTTQPQIITTPARSLSLTPHNP